MGNGSERVARALYACPAYPIFDSSTLERCGAAAWLSVVLSAGVKIIQLRLKGASDAEFLRAGESLVAACREYGALSIINDRPDIALTLGADGVHLGRGDAPIGDTRALAARPLVDHEGAKIESLHSGAEGESAGGGFIIGASARTPERAREVVSAGADYIGCGACFPTGTKDDTRLIGLAGLAGIAAISSVPVIGIGGIAWDNYRDVLAAGAAGFAAISMFNLPPAQLLERLSGVRSVS